jgi:hypothetical protein
MARAARRDRPAITCASVRGRALASRCPARPCPARPCPASRCPASRCRVGRGCRAPRPCRARARRREAPRRTHHRPPGPARLARCVTPGCSVTACRAREWDPAALQVLAVRAPAPCRPGIRHTRPRPARPMVQVTVQDRVQGQDQAPVKDPVQARSPGRGPARAAARDGTRAVPAIPPRAAAGPVHPTRNRASLPGNSTAGTRRSSARPTARSARRGGQVPAGRAVPPLRAARRGRRPPTCSSTATPRTSPVTPG